MLILLALLVAAPALAQERRSSLVLPSVVLVGVQTADLHSTHLVLARGSGHEANPIMDVGNGGRLAVKVGTTVAALWLARVVEKRGHPRIAKVTLYAVSGVMAGVAAHNYRIAGR